MRTRTFWIAKGLKFIVLFALFGVILGYAVMLLWNWLIPSIFNAQTITFWQALGMLILAKILFGLGRGGWQGWHQRQYYWKEKMEERLKNMTPEERERFREDWRRRCSHWRHYDWDEKKEETGENKTV